jgi:hypothetical protein
MAAMGALPVNWIAATAAPTPQKKAPALPALCCFNDARPEASVSKTLSP